MGNSEVLKSISKIIFVVMVFSQIFFAASTFNWNPSFSLGIRWIYLIRNQASFLVIFFCLLTKKFTALEVKCFSLIILFSLLFTHIRYFRWEAIYILATAMVIRDEDDRWVANSLFWMYLVNFIFVLSLTYFDVIESAVQYRDGISRFSLGFVHPNTTGAMILAIFITYLLKKKENPSLYVLVSFIPAFLILNQRLGSRTAFIVIIFMITCIIALKLFGEWGIRLDALSKYRAICINVLPFLFLFISYLLSFFFTREIGAFRFLNRLFTWRLGLGHFFVHEYPITLWGVDIYQNAHDPESIYIHGYRLLDNGFLLSLLVLGLFYTIFRLLYFSWLGNEMIKRGYKYIPIILTGIFLFGFMEDFIWSPVWNVLFLFGAIFLKEYAMKRKETDIPDPTS